MQTHSILTSLAIRIRIRTTTRSVLRLLFIFIALLTLGNASECDDERDFRAQVRNRFSCCRPLAFRQVLQRDRRSRLLSTIAGPDANQAHMSTAQAETRLAASPYTSYEYSFTRSCNRPTETLMDGQGWPSRFTGLVENRHWCKRRSEVHSVHRTTRRSFRTSFPETSCSSRRCVSVRTFWRRWLG